MTWFDLQLQKTTRMEGFNSKCGHLEEKVNTGPLEQNQQLKDWMLKEVMLSFTMRVRLKEIYFLERPYNSLLCWHLLKRSAL